MHPISRKNSKVDPYGRRRAAWVFDSISHFTIRSHIMDFKEFYEQRKKLSQVFRISQAPQSEGPTRLQFWPTKSIFVHRKLTGYFGIDFMLRLKLGSDFVQGCVLFCLFKDKRVFLGLLFSQIVFNQKFEAQTLSGNEPEIDRFHQAFLNAKTTQLFKWILSQIA